MVMFENHQKFQIIDHNLVLRRHDYVDEDIFVIVYMCCVLAGVILHTDAGRLDNVSADEHSTAAVLLYEIGRAHV